MRESSISRIYRLKLLLIGASLIIIALLSSALAGWLESVNAPRLLTSILGGVSDVFLVTGAIGIAVDFFTGRDKEAADTERLRSVLKEAAPEIRDAVIHGFAETPENMRGVATTEMLDKVAINALTLRLGDAKFAREIYEGLLAQAIRTPERWHDVDINVRLSSIEENSAGGAAREGAVDPRLLFDVVVSWEYTLVPSARIQRFASTDDQAELREFLADVPATSTWYLPDSVADPRAPAAFELLAYSVDGKDLPIRRSVRKHGQTYSVDLGDTRVLEKRPVRIRHVYRTVVPRIGHRFRIALTQPTHGMHLQLDHTDTDIKIMKVGDMVSSAVPTQVKFLPAEAPAKQVDVSVPGWLLPQAEVTFVWTLEDELPLAG